MGNHAGCAVLFLQRRHYTQLVSQLSDYQGKETRELIRATGKTKKSPQGYKKETAKEPPAHQSQSSNLDASKRQARDNHDPLEDSTPKFKDGLYLQAVRMLPRSSTLCYGTRALENDVLLPVLRMVVWH